MKKFPLIEQNNFVIYSKVRGFSLSRTYLTFFFHFICRRLINYLVAKYCATIILSHANQPHTFNLSAFSLFYRINIVLCYAMIATFHNFHMKFKKKL